MSLGHALRRIAEEYPLARLDPLANHPLGWVIRRGAPDEVRRLLGPQAGFLVKGSAGRGSRWAAVPWIAVFDPAVTTSATRGYYLVYLFPTDREAVHLSLAQGTVAAIRLGSEGELPGGYEAAHILGLTYGLDDLGDERRLREDLASGLSAYRALRERGGLAAVPG